jgi:hypothetical protein
VPGQHDGAVMMEMNIFHLDHIHRETPDDDLVVLACRLGQALGQIVHGGMDGLHTSQKR